MPLINIVNDFNKDNDWASEKFEAVIKNTNALWSAFQERTDRNQSAEERAAAERRYALCAARARAAAAAYVKENQGSHWLNKGDRRYALCRRLLETLDTDECKPRPRDMRIGQVGPEMPEQQWQAIAARKEGSALSANHIEDFSQYCEEHEDLDALLDADDDDAFIQHYTENLQILKDLIAGSDSPQSDLALQAGLYERYFKTRISLLASPVFQIARKESVDLSAPEQKQAFFSRHSEFTEEQRDEYDMLFREKERLQLRGIGSYDSNVSKKGLFKKGRFGTKSSFLHGSLFKGTFTKDSKGKTAGVKGRAGKIGYRYKAKFFKFSPSVSVGGVQFSASSNTNPDNLSNGMLLSKVDKDTLTMAGTYNKGAVAKVSAYGARAQVKIRMGSKKNNVTIVPAVEALTANASVKASKGRIKLTRQEGDKTVTSTEWGAQIGASAGVSLLTYGADTSISIFGIKISLGLKGYVGAAKASASATVTTGGIGFSLGAALGLGTEFSFSIDWTGLKDRLFKSWLKRKQVSLEKKEQNIRENPGTYIRGNDLKSKKALESKEETEKTHPGGTAPERIEQLRKKMTETAEKEQNPICRKVLHLAAKYAGEVAAALQNGGNHAELPKLMDRAMSCALLSNMFRCQRELGIRKENLLENAIHDEDQLKDVLKQLIHMNSEQQVGKKFWTSDSPDKAAEAFSEKNMNRVTKEIFDRAKKPVSTTDMVKENINKHNNIIQGVMNAVNLT